MGFIAYFYYLCKARIEKLLGIGSNKILNRTVYQENSQYERSIITRFLSTAFIPIDIFTTLDPAIKIIRGNHSLLDPWSLLFISWYNDPRTSGSSASIPNPTNLRSYWFASKRTKNNDVKNKNRKIRNPSCNDQVDSVFFDRTELKNVLENPKNELETKWRSRILIENTPRGNIIMYYDAYKEAFAYYSDQTAMPYKILNVVAMKYVMRFHCADFFIDETVLGGSNTNPSPLIEIIKEEISAENEKKKQVVGNLLGSNTKINDSTSPFVKVKSSTTPPIPGSQISAPVTKPQIPGASKSTTNMNKQEEDYMKNRFVYAGKFANFSVLKKPPKRKQLPPEWANFVSEYDGMFELQTEAQQNCIDYKMFKALKSKNQG